MNFINKYPRLTSATIVICFMIIVSIFTLFGMLINGEDLVFNKNNLEINCKKQNGYFFIKNQVRPICCIYNNTFDFDIFGNLIKSNLSECYNKKLIIDKIKELEEEVKK